MKNKRILQTKTQNSSDKILMISFPFPCYKPKAEPKDKLYVGKLFYLSLAIHVRQMTNRGTNIKMKLQCTMRCT